MSDRLESTFRTTAETDVQSSGSAEADFAAYATLIHTRREWIHRRVESLKFLSNGSTRRHVSVDVTVPAEFAAAGFLPIALLQKRVLRSFDAVNGAGTALPVWSKWQNGDLATYMLESPLTEPVDDATFRLLTDIAYFDASAYSSDFQADTAAGVLLAKYRELVRSADPDVYADLAAELISGFLLVVTLPSGVAPYQRMVLKFAYEEDLVDDGWISSPPIHTPVSQTWADSFHIEATAPEGVVVKSLDVVAEDPEDGGLWFVTDNGFGPATRVAHVAIPGDLLNLPLFARLHLAADRRGLPTLAGAVVFASWLLVAVTPVVSISPWPGLLVRGSNAAASTLLLLGPALVVTFLARGAEHAISAKQLRLPRLLLAVAAVLLFCGAALASGVFAAPVVDWGWWCLFGAGFATNLAFLTWWLRKTV